MTLPAQMRAGAPRIAIIAGEPSGDCLGGRLMAALREVERGEISFTGTGGPAMEEQGLDSLFPLAEVALMGPLAIAVRLPRLIGLVRRTVEHIAEWRPDILVLIDSPEFTHAVAKRVRRRLPDLPIVNYVSPTVWAWRPWRARSMRRYVDAIAAIFPFEPAVHTRLGGPPCTYVGHPVVERVRELERRPPVPASDGDPPILLVLPGSRITEIRRLMPIFGATLARLSESGTQFEAVLPAVPHLADEVAEHVADWPVKPRLLEGDAEKWNAFGSAHLALAASGTVTLELALSGVPMVVAYRLDPLTARLRWIVRVHSVVMANLVIGENAFPEFIHDGCTAENLAAALAPLFRDTPQRSAQLAAIERVRRAVLDPVAEAPSRQAARLVLDMMKTGRNESGPRGYLRMDRGT